MSATTRSDRPRVAGRQQERRLLRELLEGAASGRPAAVFVHGEAGVGKTTLVQALCAQAEADGYAVLWGRCVRFGAATSPYAPIRHALAGRGDTQAEPDPTGDGAASGRMLLQLAGTLAGVAAHQPTVLVVDDLQWADVSSLDLIAYLVAGFHQQQLLVLVTYRDEELEDGHPLHGWVADLLRLPAVHDLPLARLSAEQTAEQMRLLLPEGMAEPLVAEVFARSGGNAYLTELLVRSLPPGATRLPRSLPHPLRQVLLASWHRLSASAREVVRVLAVGGEPLEYDALAGVVARLDLDGSGVAPALSEATVAGVVQVVDRDRYWFRHPLLAEVLLDTLTPAEAAPYHAAYVCVLTEVTHRDDRDRVRHLATLALHHERSGRPEAAFECLAEAARLARAAQGFPEEARHLYRMVDLADRVPESTLAAVGGLPALLERTATTARNRGDLPVALQMATRALATIDREQDPLAATRLLVLWTGLASHAGKVERWPVQLAKEAVELSSSAPDSAEHAVALAQLSVFEAWSSRTAEAEEHASAALAAARRSEEPRALADALAARSFARIRSDTSPADGEEAYRFAKEAGDPFRLGEVMVDRLNVLAERGRLLEYVTLAAEGFAVSTASGVREFTAVFAGLGANTLLQLGRVTEATDWVREGLAVRSRGYGGAFTRLAATTWAVRNGNVAEAGEHFGHQLELTPDLLGAVGLQALVPATELHLARRQPAQALRVVLDGLPVHGRVDPRYGDELLLWGARAAADLAERADGSAVPPVDPVAALDQLTRLRAACPGVAFETVDDGDLVQPAYRALFEAECARCRREPPAAPLWEEAARLCAEASLQGEQALALWRFAEATLSARGPRGEAAAALRQAHALAGALGATALRRDVEALAQAARVPLEAPPAPVPAGGGARVGGLTNREAEVLAHLAAGRSYAEIAEALFISQKTVSVHVSNLLRKTGTRNRAEAAAFARRHGLLGGP